MGLGESIRLAFEGLRANKMRAVLTMLGIIIGIAAVIGILTVGDGLSGYINSTMSDLGASSIIVTLQEKDREAVSSEDMMSMMVMKQPETTDLMTPEMIAAMQEQFAGRLAATSLSESAGSGKAKDGRLYANVSAMGVNEGYFTVNNVKLSEGRFLQQKDDDGRRMVCVVSDRLVGNLFDGDQKQALGQEVLVQLSGGSYTFRIVGVYKYEQSAISFSIASDKDLATSLYIPLSTAKQLTGASRGYSMITVQAAVGESSTEVAAEVKNYLARYYRTNENYTVTAISMDSMISSVNSMMNTLSVAIAVIAAISLLVGGIGDEHHAGLRHRENARNRHQEGARRDKPQYPHSVCRRKRDHLPGRRRDRHCAGRGDGLCGKRTVEKCGAAGHRRDCTGIWLFSGGRRVLRLLPGKQGGNDGPHRGAAL